VSNDRNVLRAAIYCRKSSDEGLEQSFNSLQAQREACEAFITSQRQEGWRLFPTQYADGGYSGGSMDRPALHQLLQDVRDEKISIIVVYKVDRLTRSLADFAKIIEIFDSHRVSFVSVTQQFNTTSSMGRLTLNVLLSFAQFEREVTGERIRDKIAASKKKGMWMGGYPPLGYDVNVRKLVPNLKEAERVQKIFALYLEVGSVRRLKDELDRTGVKSKQWTSRKGASRGGARFSRGALYNLLQNRLYIGETSHRELWYPGMHQGIVAAELWDRVQLLMASNRECRSIRIREHSSSLLTGRIEDHNGNRLTPSFTVKNKRRYRYYVSRLAIKNPGTSAQGPTRWPAEELEAVMLNRIQAFLLSGAELFSEFHNGDHSESTYQIISAAQSLGHRWSDLSPATIAYFIRGCLRRAIVSLNTVELVLNKAAFSQYLLGISAAKIEQLYSNDNHDVIRLQAEARLQRCGGEVCLLVPSFGGESKVRQKPVPSLIKAIARARSWYERLLKGDVESCSALAKEIGVGDRYVTRVLHFAFLAPDIVQSILDGSHPPDLTYAKMARNIPLDWAEQRARFGFPPLHSQAPPSPRS